MKSNQDVEAVLNSLLNLRLQIDTSADQVLKHEQANSLSLKVYLVVHVLAMACCSLLIVFDLNAQPSILEILKIAQNETELKFYSIAFMLAIVSLLLVTLYFLILRASKHSGKSIESLIRTNFEFMKNMNLFSDLLIKFAFVCALLFGQKTEWIPAALVLFLADFLFQGKFFIFSIKTSYALAATLLAVATYMVFSPFNSILLSLSLFLGLAICSVINLVNYIKGQG